MTAIRNVSMMMSFEDNASASIKSANKSMDTLVKSAGGVGGKIESITKSMDSMSKKMGSVGKKTTAGLTLPLVGVGTAAVKTVSGFDDAMANVQKISGAAGKDFDSLREKAKELGSTTAYSGSEAADGMGVLAASGMKVNGILESSEHMFNLMSAGSIDANTAASALTKTMAQFNIEATNDGVGYIANSFAAASAAAEVGVDSLQHAMSQAGGTLNSMNMSVTGSVAAIGHLANSGMDVAVTGSAINAMGREIKANAGDLKKLGVEVYDPVTGDIKEMGFVMEDLEVALKGKTDAERDAALATVFSGQASQAATAWINKGSDAYNQLSEDIFKAENAAKTMAAIQEDTVGGAFRGVSSAMEGMMIEIGDVIKGPVQEVALFIQDLAGKFGKLDAPTKKMIVKFAAVAAAIGPVLLIGSKLLSGGSKAIGIFGKVGGAIGGMSLPMMAGVAAAALLGGAIYRLWNTNEEFRDNVLQIWNTIKTKLGEALESITQFWNTHGEEIKTKVTGIFDRIGEIVSGAFEIITEVISVALNWISEFWGNHGETIMSVASSAWNLITGVIDGAMQVIQGVITVVLGVIEGDWSAVWTGIQGIFEGVMTAVGVAWNAAKDIVGTVIEGTVNAITDKFHSAVERAQKAWQGLKTFMKNPIKGTVNAVRKGAGWAASKLGFPHKDGAYNIPYDNYPANLHKDEMVLTANAADQFRGLGGTENKVPNLVNESSSISNNTFSNVIERTKLMSDNRVANNNLTENISNIFNRNKQVDNSKSLTNNIRDTISNVFNRGTENTNNVNKVTEQNNSRQYKEYTTVNNQSDKGNKNVVTFNPVYNIELSGSATERDKAEIENVIDKKTRELFNKFFKEMSMKMA